jgi:hypothetical protein
VVARGVGIARLGGERILGRDHQRVALALGEAAEPLFRLAHAAVEIRRVDEIAAAIDEHVGHRLRFFHTAAPTPAIDAKSHGAQRQRRYPQARAAEQAIVG